QVIWNTVALTGARLTLNLYLVYTPKLPPPPPREAHNRSELRFLLARRILPFASTISSSTRLSLIKPIVRWSGPIPPPAVIPPIPTDGLSPNGAIYPCLASLSTILPTRLPVPTTTVPHFLLSLMVLSSLTSITMPPLTCERLGSSACRPLLGRMGTFLRRAHLIAFATSFVFWAKTKTLGYLFVWGSQFFRASS